MILFQQAVIATLQADPALMALLPGGVWNRELTRTGPGKTAAAWGPIDPTDPLSPEVLRPTVVVVDAGEYGSAFRLGADARVMVFAYVPANDAGRTLVGKIETRIRALLDHAHLGVAAGDDAPRFGEVRIEPRSRLLDEPAYGGTMFTSWRLTFRTAALSGVAEW